MRLSIRKSNSYRLSIGAWENGKENGENGDALHNLPRRMMLCINWSGLRKLFAWTAATARTGSALVQERAQPEIVITYRPLATTYDFLPWVGLQQELLPQCLSSGRLRCQSQI